ncbi:MAG: DUF4388 domain-containing protein [Acidobacteria bacterium]|nr:DUF4388 domain-containing protein [Acidobacteriota bacterium]
MALSGTLGDFSLADILQLIGLQRKTGHLLLRRSEEEVRIGFDAGRIVSAESSSRPLEPTVGTLLVRSGKLTEERLEQAQRIQGETLARLAHVLVQRGWVDRDTMRRQLALQVQETIFDLFRWRHGEYDFQPGTVDWDRELLDPLPCENLLMEAARLIDEWPMVERLVGSRDTVFRPTQAATHLLATTADQESRASVYEQDIDFGFIPADPLQEGEGGQLRLAERELAVLRWVDGRRSAGEIAELTGVGSFETFKLLGSLLQAHLVEPALREPEARPAVPGIFRSAVFARVFGGFAALLAVAGALGAIQELARLAIPDLPRLPVPVPAASSEWLSEEAGLDRIRSAASAARLARIERALEVHYLDTQAWPRTLPELCTRGLLPDRLLTDPWGRPYVYELHPWGYRLYETPAPGTSANPVARERRFLHSERTSAAR